MKQIYFPMTADILTVGHIKCLEFLNKQGYVTVGLLTDNALKGYKKNVVPFKDRLYILETIAYALGNIDIVPQHTLDPTENIKEYKVEALASGDGFEGVELDVIKKFKLKKINIKLQGEKEKLWSSTKIKEKCQKLL